MPRTVGRYLAGTVLIAVLVLVGALVGVLRSSSGSAVHRADAIVVLGAAQYDGTPSSVFAARLDHAADLYRQGLAPAVLTIGGSRPGDRFTEGEAGRDYLIDAGLPAAVVTAVGIGNDTLVSLRAADARLTAAGRHSVILVTDPWHDRRAGVMAADLGLAVQVSPVTSGPAVRSGVEAPYVFRETLGTIFYLLTGGSSGLGPEVV
jgi:uncharacterized SAM-binding protein YcdF (DUF218 family)